MQIEPIDLTGLISSILGISIVLIPVIGITARFALKPVVEALSQAMYRQGTDDTIRVLERRMDLLEQQMGSVETSLERLAAASDFDRALGSGNPPPGEPTGGEAHG